ncbi:MAG: hypothetical protein ACRDMZ_03815 [Solirubrobacteraceae bacterium]
MIANPNRSVTALTPLLFAPLAGAIAAAAAKYGLEIDGDAVAALFATGAAIAFGGSSQWLKGWQEHERRDVAARDELAPPEEIEERVRADVDAEADADADADVDADADADADIDPADLPEPDAGIDEELAAFMAAAPLG